MKHYYVMLLCVLPFIASGQSFEDYSNAQRQGLETHQQNSAEGSEFEAWQQQHTEEYTGYKKELMREFENYKRILKEELAKYQRSIQEVWDTVEVSRPQTWVEYSPDRKTKRVVDYSKNEIRIHVIEQKGESAAQAMEDALKDMLKERVQTAFERESVMSNVEKRLNTETPVVKRGKPDERLVLGELFDKPKPSEAEVEKKAEVLLKEAVVKKEVAKKPTTETGAAKEAMVVTIPMPKDRASRKAEQYKEIVQRHAGKWEMDEPLVFAVIHTESAFNPMATSYVPAYGMMQIVPRYAGKEAAEKLWGEPKLLAPSYLYNADNNIEIGSVYLNILYYRYFKKVKNPESRLFCAISAYNTGAGNVARAFTGKRNLNKAIPTINSMTPEQVYDRLRSHLPYQETRDYVQRVSQRIGAYQQQ
jgi:membrane-bound lytic murein transglycosylase C